MKPKLKDLQSFTKLYFSHRYPTVKWKRMKRYLGLADTKKNIIYLNPNQSSAKKFGCFIGEGIYKPKTKIKLTENERYFATLLHEIWHFKIKSKPSNFFESIEKKAIKEIKKERKLRDKLLKIKGFTGNKDGREITLDDIATEVDYNDSLNRHFFSKGKRNEYKWLEFQSWLGGGSMTEHIKVEDWAIKEFKKQRKKIKKILNHKI